MLPLVLKNVKHIIFFHSYICLNIGC